MAEHSGRVALVTGGSSGIGLATATLLAERGAAVAVVSLDDAALRAAQHSRPLTARTGRS